MNSIIQGFAEGLKLIFTGDPRTYEIALRSLEVSLSALAVSLVIGVPIGALVGPQPVPRQTRRRRHAQHRHGHAAAWSSA